MAWVIFVNSTLTGRPSFLGVQVRSHHLLMGPNPERGARSQTWYRKILDLGLRSEYTNPNSEVGKFLKYMFGLKYVPPCTVGDAFVSTLSNVQWVLITIVPCAPSCNYEDRSIPTSSYETCALRFPRVRDEISQQMLCAESLNHLERQFYKPHPSVHEFTVVLKQLQSKTYLSFNTVRYNRETNRSDQDNHRVATELWRNIKMMNYHYWSTLKKLHFDSSPSYCRRTAYLDNHWTVCFKATVSRFEPMYVRLTFHKYSCGNGDGDGDDDDDEDEDKCY
ncbi:hypothetical protein ANN_19489 [Periplaneta americana]|uniref:Uncharacterized protein n=1 Tax=Periplaneta americana TaxID=6978 RepID=A0ABQ8SB32_PERAM|nr:hypothetical protein ANN_19489 [Periplaneta americana]